MIENFSFQTRARAIDHLGREQIADCPTAISELWKNAYDAYARKVELHIFSAENSDGIPVAAILDNGHGMNLDEVKTKWLVIGTDSKLSSSQEISLEDKDGLPERKRQGQKGIGRLSSGAMGSLLLLISKRREHDFVATLIDWRIFENPYLLLNDIMMPVASFSEPNDLIKMLDGMFEELLCNIVPSHKVETQRAIRISTAWELYSSLERENGEKTTTEEKITSTIITSCFCEKHFSQWDVWQNKSVKGTAMFFANIHDDLLRQLGTYEVNTDAIEENKKRFKKTLSGFIDPFISPARDFFRYEIFIWQKNDKISILSDSDQYDWTQFCGLEHIVDGKIDERGIFTGRIKAFGKYLEEVQILPNMAVPIRGIKYVGPIDIKIGTFELMKNSTTLSEEQFSFWEKQCETNAGLGVYRDDLRVLPYGREDNDFFEIEYRRSKHAGREFWVSRRIFGRVAISKADNPNLRDKAGREGFIDNTAKNLFKQLIVDVLKESARRFFGTNSTLRQEMLPAIQKNNEQGKVEAFRARKMTLKAFQIRLQQNLAKFDALIQELKTISSYIDIAIADNNSEDLFVAQSKLRDLDIKRVELRLPAKPMHSSILDDKIHLFNSSYKSLACSIDELSQKVELKIKEFSKEPVEAILDKESKVLRVMLTQKQNKWLVAIDDIVKKIHDKLCAAKERQSQKVYEQLLVIAQDLQAGLIDITEALKRQRDLREKYIDEINSYYESFINVFSSLAEDINVDYAVKYNMLENERLEQDLDQYTSLAQLGITTEIMSHELSRWEYILTSYLDSLPIELKMTLRHIEAQSAQKELSDSLKFLNTLKMSGRKYSRTDIFGTMIEEAVRHFFGKVFVENNISFETTTSFREFHIKDWTSDIYPVFFNIINNACYWVCQSNENVSRKIVIDCLEKNVIIADNGPGVFEVDQPHLFKLFFSKRNNGRGVGLYLCKRNLAKSNHKIEYITNDTEKILPGANFKITFAEVISK